MITKLLLRLKARNADHPREVARQSAPARMQWRDPEALPVLAEALRIAAKAHTEADGDLHLFLATKLLDGLEAAGFQIDDTEWVAYFLTQSDNLLAGGSAELRRVTSLAYKLRYLVGADDFDVTNPAVLEGIVLKIQEWRGATIVREQRRALIEEARCRLESENIELRDFAVQTLNILGEPVQPVRPLPIARYG